MCRYVACGHLIDLCRLQRCTFYFVNFFFISLFCIWSSLFVERLWRNIRASRVAFALMKIRCHSSFKKVPHKINEGPKNSRRAVVLLLSCGQCVSLFSNVKWRQTGPDLTTRPDKLTTRPDLTWPDPTWPDWLTTGVYVYFIVLKSDPTRPDLLLWSQNSLFVRLYVASIKHHFNVAQAARGWNLLREIFGESVDGPLRYYCIFCICSPSHRIWYWTLC